ncbi:MAG TPA: UvrD-helicase domain-containing protein [Solirubrobacteraceae bacterium]|nr:UvrD-helicase domain-containing protein [Solirubrobacteraceae bacterium]
MTSVSPPRDPIATRLTDEQEHPVTRRSEPLLLSAGAGSGKTSVLVERFVRAVREDEVAPGKILAITFTDRAAGELRERVRARFLELGEREAARDTEAAFVGTFHGFCSRVLRSHPLLAELDPDFAILEEGMAARLRERAFGAALRAFLERERPEQAVDLIAAYGVDRVRTMIASVHAQLRSCGERFPRLPAPQLQGEEGQDLEAAAACRLLDELLAGFTDAYEQLKRDRAAVDFDDLELRARDLLQGHRSVRESWSQRFELLMVDEFQDTNPRQLAILEALERENLFTVGDELQSIYGFRHADVELFRTRRTELESRGGSLALTRNFRSRAGLIDVVNAVFQQRFAEFTPLRPGREETPADGEEALAGGAVGSERPLTELLLSDRGGWEEDDESSLALAAGLPAAPRWRQAEARVLARRVAELVHNGEVKGGEVVVLLRALGDLDVYERALQQAGLRTLAAVGAFWEHQQVADLLAYLRTLANPLDELALYSTLASPLAGVSRDGLALLALAARQSGRPVWEIAQTASAEPLEELAAGDRDVMVGFCARLREERVHCSRRTVSELIERAIEHSGYAAHALRLEWGERRLANVHKLLRLARRFEASEGRDLRAFLDHIDHLIGASTAGESDAPVDGVEPDAVRLMSIHGAKGLEFPVVCVADLGRAQNNRLPDLLVDGPRIGLQLVRLDGGKGTPTLDYGQLAEARRRTEAEEEDRILYVAMTRARERLLLSASVDFQRWPEAKQGATTISWLGPAIWPEIALLAQEAPTGAQELPVGQAAAPVRVHFNTRAAIALAMRRDLPSPPPRAMDCGVEPHGPHPRSEMAPAAPSPPLLKPAGKRIATLSYSSLSELERCGYRYYLERVLGLSEDRGAARSLGADRGLAARARGILVHRLVESLDFARPSPPTAEQVSELARELGMSLASGESAQIAGLLGAAASSTLAQRCAAATETRREYPFAFSLGVGEPLVTGVIDVHAREHSGGVLVLDYKSDRVAPETDLQALVARHYGVQRLLYALAVLREGAPSVEVVHWFLERPEDWVTVSYEAAERAELENRLAQRLAKAQQRGFAVSPRPHRGLCLTCPGRASLCSWGEETMREHPPDGEAPPLGA